MRNFNLIAITLFAACLCAFSGCSGKGELAPVSGTVTYKGDPMPKVTVTFSPEPVGEDIAVGPYSAGATDSSGKFTLTTRYGDEGAVVGKHKIAFGFTDIGESEMAELRKGLKGKGDRKKIASLKAKLKGRPILKARYNGVVEIPSDGTENLILELTDLE